MRLLGQHFYLPMILLVLAEFAFAGLAFILSASFVLSDRFGYESAEPPHLYWSLGFGAAVILGMTAMGLYQGKQRLRIEGVLVRLLVGLVIAAICLALLNFVVPLGMERPVWASSFVLSLVLLGADRVVFSRLQDHAFQRTVLVYGAGDRASNLLKLRRRSDRRGFRIAAFVPSPGDRFVLDHENVVAMDGPLLEYAKQHGIDEIVVAMDDRRRGFPTRALLDCKFAGIEVVDVLTFLERQTGKLNVGLMNPTWLIFSEGISANAADRIGARALDLMASTLLLVLTSPVFLLVGLAIFLEDGRPVLYRQRRVGLVGKEFTLYKFRSMIKDAEADGKARWAGAADHRVTRVGRIIRKLRLDELPQLFNVLRGEMSLVGPRPERPEFVEQLSQKIPYYHERHTVKPGITGWAQLCYPYGSTEHDAMEKLQFDLYYVKHRSLIFDLVVLLQTAEVILWGKGAR
jgi:sugar transferase (PEP-CTERM system associated)